MFGKFYAKFVNLIDGTSYTVICTSGAVKVQQ